MMKTNHAARLGALALALTLVSTCLMGGTLAKYVTEVTGTATATVAKWSFTANEQTSSFTGIDLGDTTHRKAYNGTDINEGVIAPGTEGSFDIVVDATGSEVGVAYQIKFSNLVNKPANLKFYEGYEDGNFTKEISELVDFEGFTGTIEANAETRTVIKTVYWQWPYETGDSNADKVKHNGEDTLDAGKKIMLDITVTGTQVSPTEVPKT